MKSKIALIFVLICCLGSAISMSDDKALIEVKFSPKGGCTETIVKQIAQAKVEIKVMAYAFTSPSIANALIEAKKRKVKIEVVLDKKMQKGRASQAEPVSESGIGVWLDGRHAIMHDKVMVIDKKTVITGSYNFTVSAETRNAENLLVIQSVELAKKYLDNFDLHKLHSVPFSTAP